MNRSSVGEFTKVEVAEVGFTDEGGSEGLLLLRSEGGGAFAMRAFSGESAMHMQRFGRGDRSSIPSVYNMIEELADKEGLHLRAVEVYPAGDVLRADLQFLGNRGTALLPRGSGETRNDYDQEQDMGRGGDDRRATYCRFGQGGRYVRRHRGAEEGD